MENTPFGKIRWLISFKKAFDCTFSLPTTTPHPPGERRSADGPPRARPPRPSGIPRSRRTSTTTSTCRTLLPERVPRQDPLLPERVPRQDPLLPERALRQDPLLPERVLLPEHLLRLLRPQGLVQRILYKNKIPGGRAPSWPRRRPGGSDVIQSSGPGTRRLGPGQGPKHAVRHRGRLRRTPWMRGGKITTTPRSSSASSSWTTATTRILRSGVTLPTLVPALRRPSRTSCATRPRGRVRPCLASQRRRLTAEG